MMTNDMALADLTDLCAWFLLRCPCPISAAQLKKNIFGTGVVTRQTNNFTETSYEETTVELKVQIH